MSETKREIEREREREKRAQRKVRKNKSGFSCELVSPSVVCESYRPTEPDSVGTFRAGDETNERGDREQAERPTSRCAYDSRRQRRRRRRRSRRERVGERAHSGRRIRSRPEDRSPTTIRGTLALARRISVADENPRRGTPWRSRFSRWSVDDVRVPPQP